MAGVQGSWTRLTESLRRSMAFVVSAASRARRASRAARNVSLVGSEGSAFGGAESMRRRRSTTLAESPATAARWAIA